MVWAVNAPVLWRPNGRTFTRFRDMPLPSVISRANIFSVCCRMLICSRSSSVSTGASFWTDYIWCQIVITAAILYRKMWRTFWLLPASNILLLQWIRMMPYMMAQRNVNTSVHITVRDEDHCWLTDACLLKLSACKSVWNSTRITLFTDLWCLWWNRTFFGVTAKWMKRLRRRLIHSPSFCAKAI